jgi:Neuraminidase (sialidase)
VNPKTGQLWVAWEDGRFRTDKLNDIVFSTSTNGGVTWSAPARVNQDPEGDHIDHWNAMIDVDRKGVVHVGYRQRDERQGNPTARSATGLSPHIYTYYQESRDGGKTWSKPLRVNKPVTDVGYAAFSRSGAFLGDYNELAVASNGWTYLVHNEALPIRKGEKCNCSFHSGNGHQHQFTYVAVIKN